MLAIIVAACDNAVHRRSRSQWRTRRSSVLAVPTRTCKGAFDISGAAPGSVAQIVVQCTAPVCTNDNGEANVTIVFIDGRRESSGYAWAGAEAPPLQIAPVCLGVPLAHCLDVAATGPEGEGVGPRDGWVRANACTTVFTNGGSGQTTYEFKDGRASVTIMWADAGGG